MKTESEYKYGVLFVLLIAIAGFNTIFSSCGGGGGGGGGAPSQAHFIDAQLFSLPSGSSLPDYQSASVEVLDNVGTQINNANVTINGVALAFSSESRVYEGDVVVAPGESVVVNVSVGGKTYTASGTQFSSYPTIVEPVSGAAWVASLSNTIKWSGNYPTTNTFLGLGILYYDTVGYGSNIEQLWPSGEYLLELASSETLYSIPAYAISTPQYSSSNSLVIVGVGREIPISGAAPGSRLVIGGCNYAPITVRANVEDPITLVNERGGIGGISVDATNIYWTKGGTEWRMGGVKKVGINGGAVTSLASGTPIGSIAVDSTNAYWTESGTIKKVGINGGPVVTVAPANPRSIIVDFTSVYWAEGGAIKKIGINGGTVTTLASVTSYVVMDTPGIAVDSAFVYWSEYDSIWNGTIKKVGIAGGIVTTLASENPVTYYNIAVDSTSVYWITQPSSYASGPRSIKKVGINGGTVTTVASPLSSVGIISGFAVDSTSIYWIETTLEGDGSATVNKVGINGGVITSLASENRPNILGIVLDSTNVYYWTNTGAIKKVAK